MKSVVLLLLGSLVFSLPTNAQEKVRLQASEKFRYKFDRSLSVLGFSPDGQLLAAGESTIGAATNKAVMVTWEMPSGKENSRTPHVGRKVLEIKSGRKIPVVPAGGGFIDFLPEGNQYLVSTVNSSIEFRDSKTGDIVRDFRVKSMSLGARHHVLRADGKMVACAMDKMISIWDVASGKEIVTFKGHEKMIQMIRFSHKGNRVASASSDKTVRIWDLPSREVYQKITVLDSAISIAFSPDDKWLAVGTVGKTSQISIRDAETGVEAMAIKPETNGAKNLLFSPNGKLFANTGGPFVQVWEISATGP